MSLILFRDGKGMGDALFLSGIARALTEQGRRPWVATNWPDLWKNNPDIRGHLPAKQLRLPAKVFRRFIVNMNYENSPHPTWHYLQRLAVNVGLPEKHPYEPRIYLDPKEEAWGEREAKGAILVQTDSKTAWTPNKNWPMERFQDVSDFCGKLAPVIQIGTGNAPPLTGARDRRNSTTVREAAALLKAARLFVGLEGGLMHLAKAVQTPAVIIFGGYISPALSGYPSQSSLYSPVPCAPCLLEVPCPIGLECMEKITVEKVIASIQAALGLVPQ